MISYLSSKAVTVSPLSLSFSRFPRSSVFQRRRPPKSPFCPSLPLQFSLACHAAASSGGVSMDSPTPDAAPSVDSVARDLQNQSLRSADQNDADVGHGVKNPRLKLEDLNWDHSFVRELPGDPRTDAIPREVRFFFSFNFLF